MLSGWRLRWMRAGVAAVVAASALSAVPIGARAGLVPATPSDETDLRLARCPDGGEFGLAAGPLFADVDASTVEVAYISECTTAMEITARVGGMTTTRRFEKTDGADQFQFDPCEKKGGTDLPDTRVELTARVGSVTVSGEVQLGPDATAPRVNKISSSPADGSKVKRGQTIEFAEGDVVAREVRSKESWQTGVQSLQLLGPDGLVENGHTKAKSNQPKPCKEKQWALGNRAASYEVPEDARGAIKICAVAADFADNQNADACATYYVGEVWEGTLRLDNDPCRANGTPLVWEGPVQVVVARNGSVTGDGTLELTEAGGDPASGCYLGVSRGAYEQPVEISGSRGRRTLRLTVTVAGTPIALDLDVAKRKAEGTTTLQGPQTVTMDLRCRTCGAEDVG